MEVHGPQGMGGDGAHRPQGGADPAVGLVALAVRHLESFVAPEALDPLVVHMAAFSPGSLGGATPSPPWSFLGERPEEGPQLDLVVRRGRRFEALG